MRKPTFSGGASARPLADLVGPAIGPVLARRGFGQSQLVTFWDEIVGKRLAAMSQPIKLQWPAGPRPEDGTKGASATLVVRVESGFALELQHCADLVIERVNAHFGWRCVSRLAFRQGPVPRPAVPRARGPVDPLAVREAADLVRAVEHEPLRLALGRLGAHVLSGERRPRSNAADDA